MIFKISRFNASLGYTSKTRGRHVDGEKEGIRRKKEEERGKEKMGCRLIYTSGARNEVKKLTVDEGKRGVVK